MPPKPETTPVPTPFAPAMSPAVRLIPRQPNEQDRDNASADAVAPFPEPKIRLEVRDVTHAGANAFFTSVNATSCMTKGVADVLRLLYVAPSDRTTTPPATRSVTFILRDMPGVAYTTGSDLDNDHKEIHFSLAYIAGIAKGRASHEIAGVVTHELVHCLQWNAFGTCPGGLIEGIADWVRLNCDLAPPHWSQEAGEKWDAGYQHTAYFLDYLERLYGDGLVRRLNEKLRIQKYDETTFWVELTGTTVDALFDNYREWLKNGKKNLD